MTLYLSPNIFQALSQGVAFLAGLAIASCRLHPGFHALFPFLGQVDRLCFALAQDGKVQKRAVPLFLGFGTTATSIAAHFPDYDQTPFHQRLSAQQGSFQVLPLGLEFARLLAATAEGFLIYGMYHNNKYIPYIATKRNGASNHG